MSSRKRDETIDRRETILQAAASLFDRYGFSKTTIDDIARETKIPRATLYLEFKDKEAILTAHIRRLADELLLHMREIAASGRPWQTTLLELMMYHVLYAYDKASKCFDPVAMAQRGDQCRAELSDFFNAEKELYQDVLRRAKSDAGAPAYIDIARTSYLLMQLMQGYLPGQSLTLSRDTLEKDARDIFSGFIKGIGQ